MSAASPPRHLLWSVPLVFVLHDAEEILTMERWTTAHRDALPEVVRPFLPIPTGEFTLSVLLILAALLILSFLDVLRLRAGKPVAWSLLAAATLVANALTHPLQALVMRGYTPGVVSAVVLGVPYGAWLWRQGVHGGWLNVRRAALLLVTGLVLQAPVAALALLGGRALS